MNGIQLLTAIVLGTAFLVFVMYKIYLAYFGECAECAAEVEIKPKKTTVPEPIKVPPKTQPEAPTEVAVVGDDD